MKKGLCVILFLIISVSGYAQTQPETETLRYFDRVKERYVTVTVEFFGWYERYRTVSDAGTQNAKFLIYNCLKPKPIFSGVDTQWSEWKLENSMPIPYENKGFLTRLFGELTESWKREPLQGNEFKTSLLTAIAILTVPNGQSIPYWFDSDGDLHDFYRLYRVVE
jgi:hypothetical protein